MGRISNLVVIIVIFFTSTFCRAAADDPDTLYRVCLERCGEHGCVGHTCFKQCNYSSVEEARPWGRQQPAYVEWNHWVCASECRYHCIVSVDHQTQILGLKLKKFQRKWPANPFHGIQEPIPATLSALTLAVHFHGWVSFVLHVNYELPLRLNKKTTHEHHYEYTGLWHVAAFLSMNSWLWAVVFHSRDVELTQKLDFVSGTAIVGYLVFLAVVRSFSIKDGFARLSVGAPVFAVTITHILYMNFYYFDHRLNAIVSVVMHATQMSVWSVWVGVTRHPSRWKLWLVMLSGGIPALLFRVCDFPPCIMGFFDAHSIGHASMIPLIHVWWSFVRDDAEFTTLLLIDKQNKTS